MKDNVVNKEKLISIILAVVMLFSIIPLASIVAWAEGASTAKHTIVWISGTDSVISGNRMDVTAKKNNTVYVRAQVQFSCGGNYTAASGEIEMRIPAHIMFKRDGTPADTIYVPLCEEGDASGETQFWYRIDDNGTPDNPNDDEIVITNYNDVSSSYYFLCDIQYSYLPSDVADGYTNTDISARFNIPDENHEQTQVDSTDTLSITNHETAKLFSQLKYSYTKYEVWNSSWGPEPENAADYYYVSWRVDVYIPSGSAIVQPYILTLKDTPVNGSVIYCDSKNAVINEDGTLDIFVGDISRPSSSYPYNFNRYDIVTKHLRSEINEEGKTVVTNNALVELNGYDGAYDSAKLSASYTYVPVNTEYDGNVYSFDKKQADTTVAIWGGYNDLNEGKPIISAYSVTANVRSFDPTLGKSSGIEKVTITDGDSDQFLYFADNSRGNPQYLTREDYSFTKAHLNNITQSTYYLDPDKGYTTKAVAYTDYNDVKFYVQKNNSTQWELWATATRLNYSQWNIQYADGTSNNGNRVNFSDEVKAVKCEVDFSHEVLNLMVRYDITINPTDYVKEIINDDTSEQLTKCYIWNTAKAAFEGPVNGTGRDDAHTHLTKKESRTNAAKTMGTPQNDLANSRTVTACRIDYYDYPSASYSTGYDYMNTYESGIIYDLLPVGTSAENIAVTTYSQYYTGNPIPWTVQYEENWRNSGRTMMIVTFSGEPQKVTSGSSRVGVTLKYDLIDTWENMIDNGTMLDNYSAYYSTCGNLGSGRTDDGNYPAWTSGNIYQLFEDLDNDGNTDASKKNTYYANNTITNDVPVSTESGFKKYVKTPDTSYVMGNVTTDYDEEYSYKLRYQCMTTTNISSNLVFYDVLETAYGTSPYWQGVLTGVDTSNATKKGAQVVVYYSTVQGINPYENNGLTEQADLTNTAYWSTIPPDDLSSVTALAFDLRNKTGGGDFTLTNGEAVYVEVFMKALPKDRTMLDDDSNEKVYAYNRASCQSTITTLGGTSSTSAEQSNIVSVQVHETVSVTVKKEWSDGAENHTSDSVTIHLYADGSDTGKTLVLDSSNNWKGTFSDLDYKTGQNKVILYSIVEDTVADYTTEYSRTDSDVPGNRRISYVVENTLNVAYVPFSFIKVDSASKAPLSGAEFKLYKLTCTDSSHDHSHDLVTDELIANGCFTPIREGEADKVFLSDENGKVDFGNLDNGIYVLVEVKSPEGYSLPMGAWKITVNMSGESPIVITALGDNLPPAFYVNEEGDYCLPNFAKITIPVSGGMGTILFTVGGVVLIGGAILLLILTGNKKKKKKHGDDSPKHQQ